MVGLYGIQGLGFRVFGLLVEHVTLGFSALRPKAVEVESPTIETSQLQCLLSRNL